MSTLNRSLEVLHGADYGSIVIKAYHVRVEGLDSWVWESLPADMLHALDYSFQIQETVLRDITFTHTASVGGEDTVHDGDWQTYEVECVDGIENPFAVFRFLYRPRSQQASSPPAVAGYEIN
ncbi:MAG: hypothetical protein Q9220_004000 [cf. Caloplaca sp. 1 TL-2023]